MKKNLSFTILLIFPLLFSSCVKSIDISISNDSNPVTGSWYISSSAANDSYGWFSFDAGIPGTFTFYENGIARYADDNSDMQGNWHMDLISTGYYDEQGVFQTNTHNNFQVQVSDSYGGNIDLYFDNISFAGNNQFVATYYDGKNIQRFTFNRY